jgi:hypothetical protein
MKPKKLTEFYTDADRKNIYLHRIGIIVDNISAA